MRCKVTSPFTYDLKYSIVFLTKCFLCEVLSYLMIEYPITMSSQGKENILKLLNSILSEKDQNGLSHNLDALILGILL